MPSDESLDKIKPKRIKLDESIHTDPIKVNDLANSVCIFDDIDVSADKKVRDGVYSILNQCLEIGRHWKITIVVTNHLPTNGKDTRRILNEAHTITYFPRSAGGRIRCLLENYVGLGKKHMQYLKKQNTRWCTIFKNYPGVYMAEHEVGLLMLDEDDEEQEDRGGGRF